MLIIDKTLCHSACNNILYWKQDNDSDSGRNFKSIAISLQQTLYFKPEIFPRAVCFCEKKITSLRGPERSSIFRESPEQLIVSRGIPSSLTEV